MMVGIDRGGSIIIYEEEGVCESEERYRGGMGKYV